MANYPISKMNKEGTILRSKSSYCSDEYAEKMCDLYLRDEIHEGEYGKLHKYYRIIVFTQNSLTTLKCLSLMTFIVQTAVSVC